MKRIKSAIKEVQGTPYAQAEGNLELGAAVRIAYACTDHAENRCELLLEAVFEVIAQDLGEDATRGLFAKVAGGDYE
jgi:CO/xanthine dehydrogenase FAD-binding subunit